MPNIIDLQNVLKEREGKDIFFDRKEEAQQVRQLNHACPVCQKMENNIPKITETLMGILKDIVVSKEKNVDYH